MPSTPPTSLPFGLGNHAILTNTKSFFNYLSNFLNKQHLNAKLAQFQNNSPGSNLTACVDIGLLETKDLSLEVALQRTTDLVANSVRSSLRSFNPINPTKHDCRVLVYGTHSYYRAKYLTQTKDFPNQTYLLQSGDDFCGLFDSTLSNTSNDVNSAGGIYWTDDYTVLDTVNSGAFDAILCFNMGVQSAQETLALINRFERILRPGGALSGTGLFKNSNSFTAPIDFNSIDANSECLSQSCFSLRAFRDSVESCGFYMHLAMDLSLEGNVMIQVMDDVRDTQSPLYLFRSGKLICARFLATKNSLLPNEKNDIVAVHAEPINSNENELGDIVTSLNQPNLHGLNISIPCTPIDSIVITGISLGLPNSLYPNRSVFSSDNVDSIFNGDNFIANLDSTQKQEILGMNVFKVTKQDGKRIKYKLHKDTECIQVASFISEFNLGKEYPQIPNHIIETLDTTYELAIAAGIEALKSAEINIFNDNGSINGLNEEYRDETGVIFASSFPCADSLTEEVSKCAAYKAKQYIKQELIKLNNDIASNSNLFNNEEYEYDRKLLFKLLVMANCQLAELIRARGPNTHINNACSSTTQAITIAEDWIKVGRCKRVIVISSDNATSKQLLPYLGTGFLALGAATTCCNVTEAAVPFDLRRKGMILGAGAVGLIIESESAALSRSIKPKVQILGSIISNSAFHATLMDRESTSIQLNNFISKMEQQHNLNREELSKNLIYFAHETCTSANGGCAKVETDALKFTFGKVKNNILIANVKGFTGHPMSVGFEDVLAVASLVQGKVPPLANHKSDDPLLELLPEQKPTKDKNTHSREYVLRFAAGFGSQFVYILYKLYNS